jgi:hypothetical protein
MARGLPPERNTRVNRLSGSRQPKNAKQSFAHLRRTPPACAVRIRTNLFQNIETLRIDTEHYGYPEYGNQPVLDA